MKKLISIISITTLLFANLVLAGVPTVDKAIVSITHDDADPTIYTNGYSYSSQYGIVGSFAVITGQIDGDGKISTAQLTGMYNGGWAICNHTQGTDYLTALTDQQIHDTVGGGKTDLDNMGFTDSSQVFIVPGSDVNDSIMNIIRQYSVMADYQRANVANDIPFQRFDFDRRGMAANTPATIKGWIDDAITNKQVIILATHGVRDDAPGHAYPIADYEEVIDYIKLKKDAGDLDVMNLYELYEYLIPFETSYAKVTGTITNP